jgi:hypothetical protein
METVSADEALCHTRGSGSHDPGIEVRMLDRVFDNFVMTPMQKIVLNQLHHAGGLRRRPVAVALEPRGQFAAGVSGVRT